jgi:hypothetical protein
MVKRRRYSRIRFHNCIHQLLTRVQSRLCSLQVRGAGVRVGLRQCPPNLELRDGCAQHGKPIVAQSLSFILVRFQETQRLVDLCNTTTTPDTARGSMTNSVLLPATVAGRDVKYCKATKFSICVNFNWFNRVSNVDRKRSYNCDKGGTPQLIKQSCTKQHRFPPE